jgi:hypothetical protein
MSINGQTIGNVTNLIVSSSDQSVLAGKESISNKNMPNGYVGLDSSGHIPSQYIDVSSFKYEGIWDALSNKYKTTSESI